MKTLSIGKIKKRDGRTVEFDPARISKAIFKAAQSVGGQDEKTANDLAEKVVDALEEKFDNRTIPTVEEVQDAVEKTLIESGHARTAKAYILYRAKKSEERGRRAILLGGIEKADTNLSFTENALHVLEKRYLLKDEEGNLKETPEELVRRVARNIATADKNYGQDPKQSEEKFYSMMANLEFLPNTPTLMNAGTEIQQLSACFVLPVDDSMEGIFKSLTDAAIIHKSGGGTGFSFSKLRPKNDLVKSTAGVASGPVSFMKIFDVSTEVIKQGGKRRGANMAILRVDHPDIIEFINCKNDMKSYTNFNISVAATDKFMEAVMKDDYYDLLNPRNREPVGRYKARNIFNMIVQNAWKNGDPGMIFLDEINRTHPAKNLGEIESTNPCGEQPLLPYESCNLGSINLQRFLTEDGKNIEWEKLGECVDSCIHFLDNVIDMNKLPVEEINAANKRTRKIGLGVMGFADLLYELGIPYDSDEGLRMAEKLMGFVKERSYMMSQKLAEKRGTYEAWKGSDHEKEGRKMRNACCLTIAPTGTIGMLAESSGGCEPNFAISYIKYVMDGTELVYTNKIFERIIKKRGLDSPELMRKIAKAGTIQGFKELPEDMRKVFVTAQDITPEWHIRMQAAFQKHVDASISKTINFPSNATIEDVEKSYLLAYRLKCKGITIYRDKSRENQVLNIGEVNKKSTEMEKAYAEKKQQEAMSKAELLDKGICPECNTKLSREEGCAKCHSCGFSVCSV
ncbi:adenosylcobalamin-dependent ribonucleoside-diphosphate reductase [Candidatus Woesearchaeota archaeon]|nr:adenosylcobalamin-dependent ribonucleoside-diphosphate reductase [Candidatus Woesearchaeota archaeon]